jgi:hypothetical protein
LNSNNEGYGIDGIQVAVYRWLIERLPWYLMFPGLMMAGILVWVVI